MFDSIKSFKLTQIDHNPSKDRIRAITLREVSLKV